ncbi:ubiquitin carboxyl-terminal hydrolase 8 [Cryptococcus deuterogattii 99/473]|uniref:ubiquitinyl hydrolase 1 n=1 Tax=Cryptococcus deuterogattii Ram5 TaxID=1296110 RepID=A0A0D0VCE5_9TREE|nr:ubiquitin carboxyl-terminal hydrolase 8 [Cryptococcus deuterogattii Ram5]KIY56085.1 ubiquitin carboxyl-terminal hydrolase 8 [Cryptococcus deuterogattii 99/473]
MTRPPSPPSFAGLQLSHLLQYASDDNGADHYPPKVWFERACYNADKAKLAERKQSKEDMFVSYSRACQSYVNVAMHNDWPDVKKKDPQLAARVKDFKPMYDSFVAKAKALKEELRQAEASSFAQPKSESSKPPVSRERSGPEITSIGNIRDRMQALAGHGMEVGTVQSKRLSREAPAKSPKPAALSSMTSSAARSRSGSESRPSPTTTTNGRQIVVTASSKPPPPPSQEKPPPSAPVSVQATGSSSRSRRSTLTSEGQGLSASNGSAAASPAQSPMPTPAAGPSRSPLPSIPSSPQPLPASHRPLPSPEPPRPTVPVKSSDMESRPEDGLAEFERAFPSLSEFGKQWDGDSLQSDSNSHDMNHAPKYPKPPTQPPISEEDTIPGLPYLPSVPISKPGLPPPPSRPDISAFSPPSASSSAQTLGQPPVPRGPSPPKPDVGSGVGLHRPASTPMPNIAGLDLLDMPDGDVAQVKAINGGGKLEALNFPDTISSLPQYSPTPSHPIPITGHPLPQPPSHPPASEPSQPAPKPKEKPKFPFSNSITPDELREYFLNPSVEMLFLDIRPEDEWKKGYVGKEYEKRGARVEVVWLDPTVLLREGMTANKLEDALSLSPAVQRQAFQNRHKYDLIIVYDARSPVWPKEGPLSRLWDMFFMGLDEKRLQRNPVILVGGYEKWREFIKMRAARHAHPAKGKDARNGLNGYTMMRSDVVSPAPSEVSVKKANREAPVYQASQYAKNIAENFGAGPQSMTGDSYRPSTHSHSQSQPYTPTYRHHHSRTGSTYSFHGAIAAPPQASIHPGPGARRRSDYIEHTGQSYSGSTATSPSIQSTSTTPQPQQYYTSPPLPASNSMTPSLSSMASPRASIDYPQTHALAKVPVPMPPPAVARPMERYDAYTSAHAQSLVPTASGYGKLPPQGQVTRSQAMRGLDSVSAGGKDKVGYWRDVVLGITGLKNLGNATYPFSTFFLDGTFSRSINKENPLGTKGELAKAWAELLRVLWSEKYEFLSPMTFRKQITHFAPQFLGSDQHDSQEFLSFVLDGLHEDLNRIKRKPPPVEMTPEREAMLESAPPEVASEREWAIYRQRNDSLIVDLFQGQYRNRLECLTCHKVLPALQNQPSCFQNTNNRSSPTCTAHPTQKIHNERRSLLGQVRDTRHLPHQRSRSHSVLARTCRFVSRKWKAGGAGWDV